MKLRKQDKPIFDKYGGHYHHRISTVRDLEYILELADGRWMATSCPLFGLNLDPTFLKFLDADGNNRIISEEVRSALRWLFKCITPSETLLERRSSLPLDLIKTDEPEGKALADAACLVLKNLNIPDSDEISLEQVRNRQRIMAQADYNGDGVIPPEVVKDSGVAQFIRDLLATVGSADDASGLKGITEALLDRFKKEAIAYLQWYDQGVIPEGQTETTVMPFGTATPAMFQTISAIRDKIEQFFAQCALVRSDARMAERIGFREEELAKLDYRDKQAIMDHLRISPIYKPNPEGILPLDESVNEFYRAQVITFRDQVVKPLIGEGTTAIKEPEWRQILSKFAPYEAWIKAKPTVLIEPLGVDKIRAYLSSSHDETVRDLIVEDRAVADEIQHLQNLEKLILYHQFLFEFVNNYVSFPYLFNIRDRAMFEMGTLVLSGREYSFSIRIENRAVHSNIAKNSGICLIYLQVTGAKPEDGFEIAVPVTRGNIKDPYVGKRGVFFTVNGRELDAQIVQVVENPISLWESIKEPFRRVYTMIGARFSQIASTIQKESEKTIAGTPADQQRIQTGITQVQQQATQPAQPATPAPAEQASASRTAQEGTRTGGLRDVMIGVGFLAAGLGTALKFLTDTAKQLTQPKTLQVLLIMIGIFLAVTILTATVSAWLKLRQRDLGVLLQASGWAINGKMRIIRPMARFFCRRTKIPRGASKHRKELLVPIERLTRKMETTLQK